MVRSGTNVIPNQPTLAIVTDGPFRYTRNPLYIGATLAYTGLALIFNSFWPLLLLPALLMVIHWGVVRREERYLEAKFGTLYLAYKDRVPRWL
jgi:protein-S-isoprenylcysteine O-methyltransferase Ste14